MFNKETFLSILGNLESVPDSDKKRLEELVNYTTSYEEFSLVLFKSLIHSLEMNEYLKEKIIYLEQNKTHPNDILVVGQTQLLI